MTRNAAKLFSAQAKITPSRIAIEDGNGTAISYAQLDDRSDVLASNLSNLGNRNNAPALLFIEDRMLCLVTIIAALKAGVVFSPLDLRQPIARVQSIIDVARPSYILCDDFGMVRAQEMGLTDRVQCIHIDTLNAAKVSENEEAEEDKNSPAYLYFTSGSTGEPKGILGRLNSIGHFCRWQIRALALDESVRCAQLTTPAFDAILRDIFTPLLCGGTVCLIPSLNILGDGGRLTKWLNEQKISLLHTTPSILRGMLADIQQGADKPDYLKHVCVAGEVLPLTVAEAFLDTFGEESELLNFYGPSETTMIKLSHRVTRADLKRNSVPIGRAIDGARAMVLDSQQRPCGVGMVGEIYIRTPFRSLGYYKRPDLTAENFVPNPLGNDPNDIVYRTGDLGRTLEADFFEYIGRKDRQIKIAGVRVEVAEVENALLRHRSVRDTVVVENKRPEGRLELAAYVVLSPEVPSEELQAFLSDYLPTAIIPTNIVSVPLLERTVTGKIDFSSLPKLTLAESVVTDYVAPETPLELELSKIWSELMQLDTPNATANFFSSGGHSLLALQVLSRVEATFTVNVRLNDFLENPTIRGLATHIEAQLLADEDDELLALFEEDS